MTTHSSGDRPRVLVLGAGYAGLTAALRLAPHARVGLIDPGHRFTERVRLHELAAGVRPDVSHPLSGFLHPEGIEHIAARATAIDPAGRVVATDDGRRLPYDRLVYALGSRTAPAGERAHTAHTAETAADLSKRLQDGPGSVAVVGGGLTGIEFAAELAEARPEWRVSLHSEGGVGSGFSPRARDHVLGVLRARGVRIEEGRRIEDPGSADADEVVWAASMVPNAELAAAAGLPLDSSGRVRVDGTLRSTVYPEVYVAGDAAAASSARAGALRMACATAMPMGSHTAASIISELRGRGPRTFDYGYLIQCVSLGRRDGLVQFVRPDDSPRDRFLTGRLAARVKEQVVRSTVGVLRTAARRPWAVPLVPGMS
ncbi:pyridine nucleotide-disulfide oxidoreductase [Streptomyces spongiicola]|uniref:Pyridine nucleotide-disulfide oxidoreductase n=1 Tax=Streptomyces spongiicola TaxID=1690221 RepID=A0ABM6VEX8_9ACTN|nr:FAD-dependent oxidoreductase [Streptomyces spongiicola]AWK12992.1 pyridine nucleotide-disulfide oxidoreductase [Streptomyces spongiicola]